MEKQFLSKAINKQLLLLENRLFVKSIIPIELMSLTH